MLIVPTFEINTTPLFKNVKGWLFFLQAIILLLACKDVFSQTHFSQRSEEELDVYLQTQIKQNPDSAYAIISRIQKDVEAAKKTSLSLLCEVYKGQALVVTNQAEEAQKQFQKLIQDERLANHPYIKILAQRFLGNIEFQNGHYYKATIQYRAAMELAKSSQNETYIAKLNEDLGKVFDKIDRPDRAIQFYIRSLGVATKLGNVESMQNSSLSLGRLYIEQGKLDSAMYFIQQSKQISFQHSFQTAWIESIVEESNVNLKRKDFAAVELNLKKLDSLTTKTSNAFLNVRFFVLKGNHALMTQGDSIAMSWYAKAEEYSNKGFTPFIDQYIKSNIAETYFTLGNLEKAYHYLRHTQKVGQAYSNKGYKELATDIRQDAEVFLREKEIGFLKIQNKLKQEKLEKELEIKMGLQRENSLKDQSLKQEKMLIEVLGREKQLQLDQLEKEKILGDALRNENELKKSALHSQRIIQRYLMFGIGSLVGLAFFISYFLIKQKEKNAIISKQAKDLEFINKEVHHRVKNNLQVISSLLDLQAHSNADNEIGAILKESKHRVQSMAFIHQNLYEGEGMNQVDMRNYIQNLVDHLSVAYNLEARKISIQTQIQPLRLHMDTVVSLGMIINELITNSVKYGYKQKTEGNILVRLQEIDHNVNLTVSDDGDGIPDDVDIATSHSFGYKMIRAFVQKLKARMTVENDKGTTVNILFTKK